MRSRSGGWAGSTRKARLPKNWKSIRIEVIRRDGGRCQWRDTPDAPICGTPGNQVDHIVAGDNHALSNLQLLCELHHRRKSAQEGGRSFTSLRTPPERHPGFRR